MDRTHPDSGSSRYSDQRDELLRDVLRVLTAWDTTTHRKNADGRLQECMRDLQETFTGICADEGVPAMQTRMDAAARTLAEPAESR